MGMDRIVILPQIEDLLYPLKSEELAHLEASIMAEGVREPLLVWVREDEKILVDGHHRYAIAKKHGIEFSLFPKSFSNLDDVLDWVDKNQLGRRNLTDEERSLTIGRIYQRIRDQRADERKNTPDVDKNTSTTAEAVAEKWNISTGTVKRANGFAQAIEHLKSFGDVGHVAAQRVLSGEIRDAITELPKVYQTDQGRFGELASGLADGAKKIRDVIPRTETRNRHAEMRSTGNASAEGESPPARMDEAVAQISRYQMGGADPGNPDDDDFYADVEKAAAATQHLLHPKPSSVELQANALQLFTCFEVLQKVDAETLWQELPKYIKEQISEVLDGAAKWMAVFAGHAHD